LIKTFTNTSLMELVINLK